MKGLTRWLAVLAASAGLCAWLPATAAAHHHHAKSGHVRARSASEPGDCECIMYASKGGDTGYKWSLYAGVYYAQWECDLYGTIVAAGITFTGGAAAPWAIGGILAGGASTAGCELGYSDAHPYVDYLYGLPHSNYCWEVYPHGEKWRKYQECVA